MDIIAEWNRRNQASVELLAAINALGDTLESAPDYCLDLAIQALQEFRMKLVERRGKKEVISKLPTPSLNDADDSIKAQSKPDATPDEGLYREKIRAMFIANNNTAMTFEEILDRVPGMAEKTLKTMVYRRSYGQFKKAGVRPGAHAPTSLWALTTMGIEGTKNKKQLKADGLKTERTTANADTNHDRGDNPLSRGG